MLHAHVIEYWMTLVMCWAIDAGAAIHPMRHPVMACDLDSPLTTIVRGRISGIEAIDVCARSYTSSLYISSDNTIMSWSARTCAMRRTVS
jgi:hypothetical protein